MTLRRLHLRPQSVILGAAIAAGLMGGVLRTVVFSSHRDVLTDADANHAAPDLSSSKTHIESLAFPLLSALGDATVLPVLALPPALPPLSASPSANISVGRLDPFSPVTRAHRHPSPVKSTPASVSTSVSAQNTQLPPVPLLPPAAPITFAPPLVPLPPIPVGAAPVPIAPLPTEKALSPVDAIEVTGVIQLGDRAGIIVREAEGQTSRHVFPGDTLANGQVSLKSIDFTPQEPLIILEYQGQEYPRVVGSGGSAGLS